jgi:ABC-type nitrate/sulfonate/bicarbonate transport system substrate-binding protein
VVSKEITDFSQLRGKTVGLSAPNSADYVFLVATLQHYGIAPNEVTFITSGSPINRLAAVSAGVVQVTAGLNAQRADETKAGTILLKSGDNPVGFPQVMFVANSDLLANHKPLLKKFVTVMQQATAWMKANPADAAALCAKTIGATVEVCGPAIALDFDRSVSSPYTWSSTYAINVDGVKSALAVMGTLDASTKSLTVDDIADTSIAGTKPE